MNVVFLDFDGVLNSKSYIARCRSERKNFDVAGPTGLDKDAVSKINRLAALGCKFVISSTWRHIYSSKESLQNLLNLRGFNGEVIGVTPQLWLRHRGDEIQKWLDDWDMNECGDGISSFVIIDDNDDMEHLTRHLIKTDDAVGVTDSNIDEIIVFLELKPS